MTSDPLASIKEQIQHAITTHPVVLYMKGSKNMPQCGYSAKVVQILNSFDIPYITYNVLEDDRLRQAIKEFSQWPTLPQLYIQGEFVGGCDIVTQLYQQKELHKLLEVLK